MTLYCLYDVHYVHLKKTYKVETCEISGVCLLFKHFPIDIHNKMIVKIRRTCTMTIIALDEHVCMFKTMIQHFSQVEIKSRNEHKTSNQLSVFIQLFQDLENRGSSRARKLKPKVTIAEYL